MCINLYIGVCIVILDYDTWCSLFDGQFTSVLRNMKSDYVSMRHEAHFSEQFTKIKVKYGDVLCQHR